MRQISRGCCFLATLAGLALQQPASLGAWQGEASEAGELDTGFHLLYELKPQPARARFAVWQASHPEDPLGSAAEAASYFFEECHRQGVLTSEFFLDNNRLLSKAELQPDAQSRNAFFVAALRAQNLAQRQLDAAPADVSALFAMTFSLGIEADYVSLIDRRQMDSLFIVRKAETFAKRLLAADPNAADAYLTLGAANYIIGSLPGFKRFILHFVGFGGDKRAGVEQIGTAAARGHYMRPFAKMLLVLVALREKKDALARIQLRELVDEFPQNPLFATELAKLQPLSSRP
jgi:hypothetical protein